MGVFFSLSCKKKKRKNKLIYKVKNYTIRRSFPASQDSCDLDYQYKENLKYDFKIYNIEEFKKYE